MIWAPQSRDSVAADSLMLPVYIIEDFVRQRLRTKITRNWYSIGFFLATRVPFTCAAVWGVKHLLKRHVLRPAAAGRGRRARRAVAAVTWALDECVPTSFYGALLAGGLLAHHMWRLTALIVALNAWRAAEGGAFGRRRSVTGRAAVNNISPCPRAPARPARPAPTEIVSSRSLASLTAARGPLGTASCAEEQQLESSGVLLLTARPSSAPAMRTTAQRVRLAANASGVIAALLPLVAVAAQSPTARPEGLWYGTGSYGTLSCLCFMASALWTDLIMIRLWLILAYIFLGVNVSLNFPDITVWGMNYTPHRLMVGSLSFIVVTLALHLWAMLMLILDEVQPRLHGDDEMLWRMFYRRCGMTRREFHHVLKLGEWRHFKAGDVVERRDKDEPYFYIIFKGVLALDSAENPDPRGPLNIASGQAANLYLLNLLGIYIGFEQDPDTLSLLKAKTDVSVFCWSMDAMLKISCGSASTALPGYFRSMALYLIAAEFCLRVLSIPPDFSEPLGPGEEEDRVSFKSVCRLVFGTFSIAVPRGLRHMSNPKLGAMAGARVHLASTMRSRNQALPAALAKNRAVLESEGKAPSRLFSHASLAHRRSSVKAAAAPARADSAAPSDKPANGASALWEMPPRAKTPAAANDDGAAARLEVELAGLRNLLALKTFEAADARRLERGWRQRAEAAEAALEQMRSAARGAGPASAGGSPPAREQLAASSHAIPAARRAQEQLVARAAQLEARCAELAGELAAARAAAAAAEARSSAAAAAAAAQADAHQRAVEGMQRQFALMLSDTLAKMAARLDEQHSSETAAVAARGGSAAGGP
ncbi:hypothetical protein HT031_004056 [Scenedesmus sp. PABB004]|nr:hypothetical protein HT031_004056 [Scenedesmus sp. PABB004]